MTTYSSEYHYFRLIVSGMALNKDIDLYKRLLHAWLWDVEAVRPKPFNSFMGKLEKKCKVVRYLAGIVLAEIHSEAFMADCRSGPKILLFFFYECIEKKKAELLKEGLERHSREAMTGKGEVWHIHQCPEVYPASFHYGSPSFTFPFKYVSRFVFSRSRICFYVLISHFHKSTSWVLKRNHASTNLQESRHGFPSNVPESHSPCSPHPLPIPLPHSNKK